MDYTKLVSLLDSRRLFFSRSDKLGDPFEGSWPRVNVLARSQPPIELPEASRAAYANAMEQMGATNRHWPRYTAVSCWHLNEHESAAMWKLYLKSDEGIAIQSTYGKFKKSLIDDQTVYVGLVKYIDYEKEWVDAGNALTPFVHKRKSFEHEREVRAIALKWPTGGTAFDFTQETISDGLKIKVDVESLVERVYVAPSCPNWFADLTKAIIQKYGYHFEVIHSRLDEKPVY